MKSLFLTLLLSMGAVTVSAQKYDYLILQKTDGNVEGIAVDGLKLTFDGGKLVAKNATDTKTIALSQMHKLYFSEDITSVGTVVGNESQIEVGIVDGKLQVTAPEGSKVKVYGLDGREVSTDNLSKGVYVVRVNDQSFKVLSK